MFFIPYVIMLVFVGIPIFLLELSLGQFSSSGPINCWELAPIFKGKHVVEYTVDLVIFVCLDSREFGILGHFMKSRIRKLLISMIGSAMIIINLRDSWIREFVLLAKFAKIKTLRTLLDLCSVLLISNIIALLQASLNLSSYFFWIFHMIWCRDGIDINNWLLS